MLDRRFWHKPDGNDRYSSPYLLRKNFSEQGEKIIRRINREKMASKKTLTTKRGIQTKAGQLLSRFLRDIAAEKTEVAKVDGDDVMVTKAEAIARLMWQMALGFTEQRVEGNGLVDIHHAPDRAMISLVFDRIEGKAAPMAEIGKKRTIADKVSEQGKKRIEKAGQLANETGRDRV